MKKIIIGVLLVFGLNGCSRYYDKHCNLFSTDESALCAAALLGSLPEELAKYPFEKKKEQKHKQEFLENRKVGVIQGERSALENCAQFCHMSTQDSSEDVALSKLASEKLIQLDDPKVPMTADQIKAMITAYKNLQHELPFSNHLKEQYVERAWGLVQKVMEKNDYYKIDRSSLDVIGGLAYLFHDRLIEKNIEQAKPIFDRCMSDQFWAVAHFELSSLEVMQFCKVSLNWYSSENSIYLKQGDASNVKQMMNSKWEMEWNLASKKKYPSKS